jgi:hypothetical protein
MDGEGSLAEDLQEHASRGLGPSSSVARQSGWEARDNQDGFSAVATRG